jgi:hypothetical protein
MNNRLNVIYLLAYVQLIHIIYLRHFPEVFHLKIEGFYLLVE